MGGTVEAWNGCDGSYDLRGCVNMELSQRGL